MLPWRSFSFKRNSSTSNNGSDVQKIKPAYDKAVAYHAVVASPVQSNTIPSTETTSDDSQALALYRSAAALRNLSAADIERFWQTLSVEERSACVAFSQCVARDIPRGDCVVNGERSNGDREVPLPNTASCTEVTLGEEKADSCEQESSTRANPADACQPDKQPSDCASIVSANQTQAEERVKETEQILARAVSQVLRGVEGELLAMKDELKSSFGEDILELRRLLQENYAYWQQATSPNSGQGHEARGPNSSQSAQWQEASPSSCGQWQEASPSSCGHHNDSPSSASRTTAKERRNSSSSNPGSPTCIKRKHATEKTEGTAPKIEWDLDESSSSKARATMPHLPNSGESDQQPSEPTKESSSAFEKQPTDNDDEKRKSFTQRRQTIMVVGGTLQLQKCEHHEDCSPSEHYDVDSKNIGEGSFGSVCVGTDRVLGTKRAIKTVPKLLLEQEQQSLWDEIEIMRQLDHPHLIRLFATYEDDKNIYLVTELCSGGELFDALAETNSGFTEKTGAKLMKQMTQAVGYLHARKICHRDLKPENFMLRERCEISKAQIKLIDFGSSKMFSEDEPMTTKICTVHYVAPEILTKQAKPYTELCDIWSLGVIMYIILCGQAPFSGENDMAVMKAIKKGKYSTEPAEVWDHVSSDAKDLLRRMLEVLPDKRASAKQVLNHRWITEVAPEASGAVLTLASRLRAFRSQNRLKKIALQVIAQNLCEEKIDHLRAAFLAIDSENQGSLSVEQIETAIKASGMDADARAEVTQVLAEMAGGGNGMVNYSQFLGATISRRQYLQEEAVKAAFNCFDIDGDGHITKEELATVLGVHDASGSKVSGISGDLKAAIGFDASEVDRILQEVDQDGDGEIDFKEFMDMMAKMA